MQVILLERIERLGQMGDVVTVKPGYARNFLLPQKKAMRANEENRKHFDEQRAQLEARNLEHRTEAEQVAAKMAGVSVVLVRQAGEAGQLYGSVNARDISEAVSAQGFSVERHQVEMAAPIKTLGVFGVKIALHPEVAVTFDANVARSPDEAEIQARTGRAVLGIDEEERENERAKAEAANQQALENATEAPTVTTADEILAEDQVRAQAEADAQAEVWAAEAKAKAAAEQAEAEAGNEAGAPEDK